MWKTRLTQTKTILSMHSTESIIRSRRWMRTSVSWSTNARSIFRKRRILQATHHKGHRIQHHLPGILQAIMLSIKDWRPHRKTSWHLSMAHSTILASTSSRRFKQRLYTDKDSKNWLRILSQPKTPVTYKDHSLYSAQLNKLVAILVLDIVHRTTKRGRGKPASLKWSLILAGWPNPYTMVTHQRPLRKRTSTCMIDRIIQTDVDKQVNSSCR